MVGDSPKLLLLAFFSTCNPQEPQKNNERKTTQRGWGWGGSCRRDTFPRACAPLFAILQARKVGLNGPPYQIKNEKRHPTHNTHIRGFVHPPPTPLVSPSRALKEEKKNAQKLTKKLPHETLPRTPSLVVLKPVPHQPPFVTARTRDHNQLFPPEPQK